MSEDGIEHVSVTPFSVRVTPEFIDAVAERVAALLGDQHAAQSDRWMSTKDAAVYLGLTPNALHKLTAARSIPFAQDTPGGKCWFLRSDLDAWRRG